MTYENIPQLIDALGGNKVVAVAIDVKPEAVTAMKRTKAISQKHRRKLIDFANSPRLTPALTNDKLAGLHDLERIEP